MPDRWCADCGRMVQVRKRSAVPAVALVLSIMFFAVVPFFGTVIGIPAILISLAWLMLTKSVCGECGGVSLSRRDPPTEAERIVQQYESGRSKNTEQ